jgi:acyl-CoA thioester hydrolase
VTRSTCQIRVRYAETDQMRVAYYANYLAWFEVGRANHMRQKGMTYRELESQDIFLPVVEARCRYIKPARYDDLLEITTRVNLPNRVRVYFDYEIRRAEDGELLAEGTTHHVAVDTANKPKRLPESVTRLLK